MAKSGSAAAEPESKSNFLIAGIGASEGSIAAFQEFFRNVPPDSGLAYVVVLHPSPASESRLADVLQSTTSIPVTEVHDAVRVVPDHVYVIPPNRGLAMQDGMLVPSPATSFEERRAPIDSFFRTLAGAHGSRAVSVILSGSGADGSMGVRRVKEHNGLVVVQDPAEAELEEMPRNAIATGLVDFVLPAALIPGRILAYRDEILAAPPPIDDRSEDDEQALTEIFTLLRDRTGHDFTNDERATTLRRLRRRLAIRELKTLSEYVHVLREDRGESVALLRELLVSVTSFFRDAAVWKKVEDVVIPALFRGRTSEDHVRVWVAGCATGEEAYSIAMLLADAASQLAAPPEIQLFATDLDEEALARARSGLYTTAEIAGVPPERLRRHFDNDQNRYSVRRELRELVLFAPHDLIEDPPFSHVDFVSCRNVLIDLGPTAQARTIEVLHSALEPGGYLLLGTAESIEGSNFFAAVDDEQHLFQSRAVPRVAALPPSTLQLAEDELVRLRAQMRATVERYELQAEEAKAADEEQAINEALRTVNQELEVEI
ncbi:MAG TPA: CheR family methyltransferase, partial [Thermoanaerobaculia bacterium]